MFWQILQIIDKVLFTENCLQCNKRSDLLCPDCMNSLPRPEKDLPSFIYALYEYRTPVIKKILTDAKYRKRFAGLRLFSKYIASSIDDVVAEYVELSNYESILLIPVPISNKRLRHRGFNQAEIITREAMHYLDGSVYKIENTIVRKTKDRTPQASIKSRHERLKSPQGTFTVSNKKTLTNCLCIVIDDITTTGGTIKELRRILLESGAVEVIGITLAH